MLAWSRQRAGKSPREGAAGSPGTWVFAGLRRQCDTRGASSSRSYPYKGRLRGGRARGRPNILRERCPLVRESGCAGCGGPPGRAGGAGREAGAAPEAGSAPGRGFKSGKAGAAGKALSSAGAERWCSLGTAMALRARGARRLGSILLFALLAASAASFSWDLPEPRSRASKIRVHPRGNLWATGHFMGKKSVKPPSPPLLGTAPHTALRDQRLQLSHDLLRILLLRKALGTSPGGPPPHTQGAAGADAAEVMPLMRKTWPHGLDGAHPGKVLNGTLAGTPSGCKSWAQISITPLL